MNEVTRLSAVENWDLTHFDVEDIMQRKQINFQSMKGIR